jgi:hypothetical protein
MTDIDLIKIDPEEDQILNIQGNASLSTIVILG